MSVAKTLKDAYYDHLRVFQDDLTIDTKASASRYIPRPATRSPHGRLVRALLNTPAEDQHQIKALVTGQRGTGKSMELVRLAENAEVKQAFEVLFLDAKDRLNLARVVDIRFLLVSIAQAFAESIVHYAVDEKRNVGFASKDEDIVREWIRVLTDEAEQPDVNQLDGHGLLNRLSKRFLTVSAELQSGKALRERLRTKTEVPKLKALTESLHQILVGIVERPVLVIIDSLDKVQDPDSQAELFKKHLSTLNGLKFPFIGTIPYAMRFEADRQVGIAVITVPNIKVIKRDAPKSTLPDAVAYFREVLTQIIDLDLVTDALIEKAARLSGGIPREFGRLVRAAIGIALEDEASAADLDALDRARASIRRDDLQPLHTDTKVSLYLELVRARPDLLDVEQRDLMASLLIIEYSNDVQWYAVHPLLHDSYDASHQARHTRLETRLERAPTAEEIVADIYGSLKIVSQ